MSLVASPRHFRPVAFSLYDAIVAAGASANLALCVDAGLAASYPGTGQSLKDVSGGGRDLYLGAGSGSSTDDPTFAGAAGALTAAESFSLDGGDFFDKQSANDAAINNLHKAAAIWGFIGIVHVPNLTGTGTNGLFGDAPSAVGTYIGIEQSLNLSNNMKPTIRVRNGAGLSLDKTADTALNASVWNFVGLSLNEAGGAVSFHWLNGAYNQVAAANLFDGHYSSPSAAAASWPLELCGSGNGAGGQGSPPANGSRFVGLAIWSGSAPTKAQLDAIYATLRGRFGL